VNINGKDFLEVRDERYIEVIALSNIVEHLKKKGLMNFILMGKRRCPQQACEERFFSQLKENVDGWSYSWIRELYEVVKQLRELEVRWGRGRRWFTMRFYVRKWDVDPIVIQANGRV